MAKLKLVGDAAEEARAGSHWDALIAVGPSGSFGWAPDVHDAIHAVANVDAQLDQQVAVHAAANLAGRRLVLAPPGSLTRDHDDVRRYGEAAQAGIRRARDAGSRRPLILVGGAPDAARYAHVAEVAALGALGGLWEPWEAGRDRDGELVDRSAFETINEIGFAAEKSISVPHIERWTAAVEAGRALARDIGGSEPDLMLPSRIAELCRAAFDGTGVEVQVQWVGHDKEDWQNAQAYPLIAAVGRASQRVKRHRPCVIRLEYTGGGPITRTLLLAGKGLVYDTGGADIKAGGHMAGMSRDKCGGAAVAGFLKAVAELAPSGVRVIGEIGAVRNNVGSDSFVSDEILVAHSGRRVRIGNTDAEGRLVLADLLSHLREDALHAENPLLFSIATLTGHAALAMGPYTAAIENGPARAQGIAARLFDLGEMWGDPFEVSHLRREDWDFVRPRSKADDVLSCNNEPSSRTTRGHQFPAAFLNIASGLDAHGGDSAQPLPYTHLDVAGSAVEKGDFQHGRPTGAPIVALTRAFLE